MAGEARGVWLLIDGVLVPAATVPGQKGDPGGQGPLGPAGPAAVGVHVGDEPPPSPSIGSVWLDTSNAPLPPSAFVVGEPGAVPYQNGWVRYDTTYAGASYVKTAEGLVVLWGMVRSGTTNTAIFTLPEGYRPAGQILHDTAANGALSRVDVFPNGEVRYISGGSNAWLSLSGIAFMAAT